MPLVPGASATAAAGTTVAPERGASVPTGDDLTFHMITHSDDGPFWSVVQRGMDAAAEDLGVTVVWMPSNNDPGVQVQLIEQAVGEGSDGIASALASPDQLIPPLQAAVAAGIPVITLNSGSNDYQEIGAITHVGQTEFIAGQGAGERFNELGATKILCGRQEESNVALEERCEGLADTFEGEVISEFVGLDADQTEQQNPIAAALQADPAIDGFMGTGPVIAMSGLNAATDAGPRAGRHRRLRHHARDHRRHRGRRRSPSPSTSSSTCRATCRSCSCTCTSRTRTPLVVACRSSPVPASSRRRMQRRSRRWSTPAPVDQAVLITCCGSGAGRKAGPGHAHRH